MPKFLAIYQAGGGSTAEAMNIDHAFGPYDTADEADAAGRRIYKTLAAVSSLHNGEALWQVLQVPDTTEAERDAAIQAYIDAETEYWTS